MGGIYTITNIITNQIYVGFTSNFKNRSARHFCDLRNNKHINPLLQRSFNKYKEENFVFEILEECEEGFYNSLEHYWCLLLNSHNITYGFNILKTHPYYNNYPISKEQRNKISDFNRNRVFTEEHKTKISISQKKVDRSQHNKDRQIPVYQYDMNKNFVKKWNSFQETKKGGFNPSKVCLVASGKRNHHKNFIFSKNNFVGLKKLVKLQVQITNLNF